MIENVNASKMPSNGEFIDVKKYIGVASINVLAINPNNEKLRKYGWSIAEDADEPTYVTTKTDENGKVTKNARIRFLVQIQDLEDKPVISLDFWCRPEIMVSNEKKDDAGRVVKPAKCKIIDAFGRTAWGTKEECKAHKIPVYASGQEASIATPYKPCHPGEEEMVQFLFKYLNITPLQVFDRNKQVWLPSKNPGRLTIDDWAALCDGNIEEIANYIALQPENRVKVILGVRTTDDNKTYQTFLNTTYIGNGALPDKNTGEYTSARKAIDKYFGERTDSPYSFSATPVVEWKETATEVKDNSDNLFEAPSVSTDDDNDLPF